MVSADRSAIPIPSPPGLPHHEMSRPAPANVPHPGSPVVEVDFKSIDLDARLQAKKVTIPRQSFSPMEKSPDVIGGSDRTERTVTVTAGGSDRSQ